MWKSVTLNSEGKDISQLMVKIYGGQFLWERVSLELESIALHSQELDTLSENVALEFAETYEQDE